MFGLDYNLLTYINYFQYLLSSCLYTKTFCVIYVRLGFGKQIVGQVMFLISFSTFADSKMSQNFPLKISLIRYVTARLAYLKYPGKKGSQVQRSD